MSKQLIDAEDAKMRILNLWAKDRTIEDACRDGNMYAYALVDAVDEIDGMRHVPGVVRCKECRRWSRESEDNGWCEWLEQIRGENWYCADGEEP